MESIKHNNDIHMYCTPCHLWPREEEWKMLFTRKIKNCHETSFREHPDQDQRCCLEQKHASQTKNIKRSYQERQIVALTEDTKCSVTDLDPLGSQSCCYGSESGLILQLHGCIWGEHWILPSGLARRTEKSQPWPYHWTHPLLPNTHITINIRKMTSSHHISS